MRRVVAVVVVAVGLVACGTHNEATSASTPTVSASEAATESPSIPKDSANRDAVYKDLESRLNFLTGPLRGVGDIAEVRVPSCGCRIAEFRGRSLLTADEVTAAAVKFGRDHSAIGVSTHPSDAEGTGASGKLHQRP